MRRWMLLWLIVAFGLFREGCPLIGTLVLIVVMLGVEAARWSMRPAGRRLRVIRKLNRQRVCSP